MSIISSALGGGSTGLTESEVDARVVAVAPTASQSSSVGPATGFTVGATIADDAAWSYDFGTIISAGSVIVTENGGIHRGIFAIRANTTPHVNSIASNGIATTTGALSGTTGSDGTVTISTTSAGLLYIENRSGTARYFQITINRTQIP